MKDVRHNLLWTGGWDSTFRLCELVLVECAVVQPIYMLDDRAQRSIELTAVRELWHDVRERAIEPERLRRPAIYQWSKRDDPPRELRAAYNEMVARYDGLGGQYLKLAALIEELGLRDVELCWARGEVKEPLVQRLYVDIDARDYSLTDTAEAVLFGRFVPATLRYTKADMRQLAEEHGFIDILRRTWFCESPVGSAACGRCGPCQRASQSGEPVKYATAVQRARHDVRKGLKAARKRARRGRR